MLTKEDIAEITQQLLKANNEVLEEQIGKKFNAKLEEALRPLKQDIARLERGVEAIETVPVPNGRPKTYLSATEVHSVTGSRRTRYGYQG